MASDDREFEVEGPKGRWCGTAKGLRERARYWLNLSIGFVSMSSPDELIDIFKARGYTVRWGRGAVEH